MATRLGKKLATILSLRHLNQSNQTNNNKSNSFFLNNFKSFFFVNLDLKNR